MVVLDHIALIVSSEKSLRFYEKLGFEQRGLAYGHAAPEND